MAAGPLALGATGLIAGLIAAGIVQATFPLFTVPEELLPSGLPSPEALVKADLAQFRADRLNTACAGALFGVSSGLLLGLAAARRLSIGRVIAAGLIAAIVAGAMGGLAGYFMPSVRSLFGRGTVDTDLWFTVAAQAFLLGLIGLGIGAGLAFGARGTGSTAGRLIGGLVGGVLGAAVYPVTAAVLFATADTERPVPEETALQFLWLGTAGLLVGVCVGGLQRRRPATTESQAT